MANEKFNTTLLRAFNIRNEEIWQVKTLFLHYFFQGIGIALFYVVATTLFLDFFKIDKLPYVFLIGAGVLLVSGRIYAYLEHTISIRKLMYGVLLMLLALTVLGWIGIQLAGDWDKNSIYIFVPFALMVIYRLIYLLSNLQFWGLSALLFDIRQSKRLFGLISAGDRPAKLLGYLSITFLVKYLGVSIGALLIIAAFAYLISIWYLKKLMNSPEVTEATTHSHDDDEGDHEDHSSTNILANFFGNDYILSLSIMAMVVVAALSFIEYEFYTEVKYKFKGLSNLAVFLSLFFALENGITILLKFFFTGRIINKLGVKWTLLMLPLSILLISLFIMFDHIILGETSEGITALWMFGFMSMTANILYSVLHAPTFLSLFQPLNIHLRLHGHTVTKGFMEPIGLGIAGLIMVGGQNLHVIGVYVLDYGIATICVLWVLIALRSYTKYLGILDNAIKKHFLEGSEIGVQDESTLELLKAKLKSEQPEEVIYSLELLKKQDPQDFRDTVVELLGHPSEEVKLHALNKIEELKIDHADEQIEAIIDGDAPSWLKETAIRIYCTIDEDAVELITPRLDSGDQHLKKGAITGLMKSGGVEAIVIAGQELLKLIESTETEERKLAASIIGELGIKNFYKPIIQFFESDHPDLQRMAVNASGRVRNAKLLPYLIHYLTDRNLKEEAMNAMELFGEDTISIIQEKVRDKTAENQYQLRKFIQLCGRIRSVRSIQVLTSYIDHREAKIRDEVLRSLFQLQFKAPEESLEEIYTRLDLQFKNAYWLLQAKALLLDKSDYRELNIALGIELEKTKERIFNLLNFLYPSKKIESARNALTSDEKERRANALEILDNTVSKRMQPKIFALIDEISLDARIENLEKQFGPLKLSEQEVFNHILEMGSRKFNRWTQASALSALPVQPKHLRLVANYIETPFKILNENALYALARLQESGQLNGETQQINEIMAKHKKLKEQGNLMEIEKIVILKGTSMFANTPENILVDIAAIVKEERKTAGERVFEQGDIGNCMYIIYEGHISIHAGGDRVCGVEKP